MERLRRRWGQNVARRRKELRLSQLDLAKAVGVTQQTISSIERGEHAPSDALKVRLVQHLEEPGAVLFPLELGASSAGATPS